MFKFLLSKLMHKKWMVLCLLIGNILLISIAVSYPMYKQASLNRMLNDEFNNYREKNAGNPGVITFEYTKKKNAGDVFVTLDNIYNSANDAIGAQLVGVRVYAQAPSKANLVNPRDDVGELKLRLTNMSGVEEQVSIVTGQLYSEGQDVIQAIVSENCMIAQNLMLGDELAFTNVKNAADNKVRVVIVGVFREMDAQSDYWVEGADDYADNLFIAYSDFEKLYLQDLNTSAMVKGTWYTVVDTGKLTTADIPAIQAKTRDYIKSAKDAGGTTKEPAYLEIFEEYSSKANRVMASLMILEVPILILLCAFLFMISGQMLSMEQNEISILKSRGASGGQIFGLYLMQSGLLAVLSAVVALPLGIFMTQLLGSSNAFLEFVRRRALDIDITAEVLLYGLAAVIVSILVTVIPVISYSKVSIVNLKQRKNRAGKRLWQKLYLDVVILAVSIYGYYVFSQQKEEMTVRVMSGSSLDPLLYFSSSLFILGMGLVAIRIWPWLVKLVFKLVGRAIKPETYASFLQIIRTGSKQMFIMMFLVLTVALGIFNSTVARTILSNATQNTAYRLGADIVMQEKWKDNSAAVRAGMATELIYTEPDYSKFNAIDGVANVARVLDTKATDGARLLGIVTNEFGLVAQDTGLDDYALIDYLNVLATTSNAVLVSENYRSIKGMDIGDSITVTVDGKNAVCKIYGFFNYFPTYVAKTVQILPDGSAQTVDNYMVVGNLSFIQSKISVTPYDLWVDLKGDNADAVAAFIAENKITMAKYDVLQNEFYEIRNDTLFQGTSGILTMSFIVILILCGVGFLIYWVLSIRERELLFGVFRAMGMSRRGIIRMLLNEQLFSSVLFIGVGAGIGALVSTLFVPLIQIAYTADNQVLPLKLITQSSDLVRLFVIIAVMFIICMAVLARIVFSMKITNALKLGED
ncbi:MAG: ABC transporter permease [Lachnospiraceae bacterium]|nr:ABC transporter permease [Lachnospiraceae bacterium]